MEGLAQIGNAGANLRQLTSGFSIFPNEGLRRRPYLIDRIIDRTGQVIYSTPVLETEVISPGVAHLSRRLLTKVIDEGTASSIRSEHGFREPAGGKTGTTNDYKDAWFCGYSDRLTCGVWLGLDQPQTIISEGYAGRLAVPIWADIMNASVKLGYLSRGTRVDVPLTSVALCRASGHIATLVVLDELWQHGHDQADAQDIEHEGDEDKDDGWAAGGHGPRLYRRSSRGANDCVAIPPCRADTGGDSFPLTSPWSPNSSTPATA